MDTEESTTTSTAVSGRSNSGRRPNDNNSNTDRRRSGRISGGAVGAAPPRYPSRGGGSGRRGSGTPLTGRGGGRGSGRGVGVVGRDEGRGGGRSRDNSSRTSEKNDHSNDRGTGVTYRGRGSGGRSRTTIDTSNGNRGGRSSRPFRTSNEEYEGETKTGEEERSVSAEGQREGRGRAGRSFSNGGGGRGGGERGGGRSGGPAPGGRGRSGRVGGRHSYRGGRGDRAGRPHFSSPRGGRGRGGRAPYHHHKNYQEDGENEEGDETNNNQGQPHYTEPNNQGQLHYTEPEHDNRIDEVSEKEASTLHQPQRESSHNDNDVHDTNECPDNPASVPRISDDTDNDNDDRVHSDNRSTNHVAKQKRKQDSSNINSRPYRKDGEEEREGEGGPTAMHESSTASSSSSNRPQDDERQRRGGGRAASRGGRGGRGGGRTSGPYGRSQGRGRVSGGRGRSPGRGRGRSGRNTHSSSFRPKGSPPNQNTKETVSEHSKEEAEGDETNVFDKAEVGKNEEAAESNEYDSYDHGTNENGYQDENAEEHEIVFSEDSTMADGECEEYNSDAKAIFAEGQETATREDVTAIERLANNGGSKNDHTDTLPLSTIEHEVPGSRPTNVVAASNPVGLALPSPVPPCKKRRDGGPLILSRQKHPPTSLVERAESKKENEREPESGKPDKSASDMTNNNNRSQRNDNDRGDGKLHDTDAKEDSSHRHSARDGERPHKRKPNNGGNRKKKDNNREPKVDEEKSMRNDGEGSSTLVEESLLCNIDPSMENDAAVPTTTEAIQALPRQEVSITSLTRVKMHRNESSASLSSANISDNSMPTKIIQDAANFTKSGGTKPSNKSQKRKGNNSNKPHPNHYQDRKAAYHFNNAVLDCVQESDPHRLYDLLHNKKNHKFALDSTVVETTMKAYVVAAMFEDALYCLRNFTMPETLSTVQTERILTCIPQNLRNSSAFTAADMINALCVATKFDTPTVRTYFLRIVRGIALEFLEEATSARDRICSASCERLVRSGLCVVDAKLKRGKRPSDLIVVPGHQLGVFIPDASNSGSNSASNMDNNRGIQAGDAVSILPYAGPYPMSAESLDRNMIEATVTSTSPNLMLRLQDKGNANLHSKLTEDVEGNVYRIDKLANRMGFNRQLSAAVGIASPLQPQQILATTDGNTGSSSGPGFHPTLAVRDPRRPSPALIKAITAMDENINRVMKKTSGGGLPRGELTSTAALCSQAIPWNAEDDDDSYFYDFGCKDQMLTSSRNDQDAIRQANRLALEKYGALDGLNESQALAVEGATSNRLTLVQGPPGTGKTAVAIRILQHWARLASADEQQHSSSNHKQGSNNTPVTTKPILATSDSNIAVDNLVEGCAAVGLRVVRLGRPEAIRPELLRYCIDRPSQAAGGDGYNTAGGAGTFKERAKQLKSAQVICCTCIGSGSDILDALGPLERVLVDEATQATEPAVLVPLMRGCRQLVLVGDHCQLPPTVLSTRAEEEGLGVPLFSRMVACGVPPFMLDTQYRMHPCIAMFPSDLFYGGLLKNGVSAPERRPLAGFPWPREEFPVAFMPVRGEEMDDGVSKYNEAEAAAACDAVSFLLQGGQCGVQDIAVVTPYAAQARLIRRMTRRLTQNTGPPFIEVSSVDGFQGREKEAVVFSSVRSNDYGAIGFTSDWRRVNVSFTRARRALIVIGNDQTLRRGDPDTWMPWLAWVDAHGLNMDKPGMPRGRYDPEQLRRVRGGTTAAEMLKDVLERQQAQLESAARLQARAEKNTAKHILASSAHQDTGDNKGVMSPNRSSSADDSGPSPLTLQEDLAQLQNADGNWDDDDEEDDEVAGGTTDQGLQSSNGSLAIGNLTKGNASVTESQGGHEQRTAVDVWDL